MAQKKHYSEEELFYLFYSLLEAAKEFQLKCIPVGDIRPGNMVITKKQQLKMITVASIPSESTNISKFLDRYDLKTIFYFSPEELDYINSKGYSAVTYPNAKTEAYSIGLTIMDAALFESCEDLYNWSSLRKEIKKDLIDLRLKKIAFKYPVFETYLSKVLAF